MKKTIFSWRTVIVDFDTKENAQKWIEQQNKKYRCRCYVMEEGFTSNNTFDAGKDVYSVEMRYANSKTIPSGW